MLHAIAPISTLVVIDPSVHSYHTLLNGLQPDAAVLLFDGNGIA